MHTTVHFLLSHVISWIKPQFDCGCEQYALQHPFQTVKGFPPAECKQSEQDSCMNNSHELKGPHSELKPVILAQHSQNQLWDHALWPVLCPRTQRGDKPVCSTHSVGSLLWCWNILRCHWAHDTIVYASMTRHALQQRSDRVVLQQQFCFGFFKIGFNYTLGTMPGCFSLWGLNLVQQ